jgi:dephospho-CoA kinase
MGKTTVSAMLRHAGVPVFDADAAVHRLQGPGGRLLAAIEAGFLGTTGPGGVDRAKLARAVLGDRAALRRLERIVHPAVASERRAFLRRHKARRIVGFDVPLLFETRGERLMDCVAVVSAPRAVQRRRVLARPGMTAGKFAAVTRRQLPDREKRRRADVVIPTGRGKPATAAAVRRLVACLARRARR